MDDAQLQELKQRAPGLAAIYHTGRDTILRAADLAALEQARVAILGRKSALTEFLRSIPTLPPEERPLRRQGRQPGPQASSRRSWRSARRS